MKRLGIVEMIVTTVIWGSIPILALLSDLPSPVFVFFRVFLTSLFLFPIVKKIRPKLLLKITILLSGLSLALNWIFLFYSIRLVQVSEAILLYYTGPIFATIIMHFLGERINGVKLISILLAFGGIILILDPTEMSLNLGIYVALLSGLFYGILAVTSKLSTKLVSSKELVLYQTIIASALTFPFLFAFKFSFTLYTAIIVLVAALVNTLLALFLWYDALTKISVQLASVLSYLDPVFAIIFAYIFLAQMPSTMTIVGGILIIVGGIISIFAETF
ncbi:DMT family transporter [Sulfurisphaera tokodaii]|uniref:DMT family transporter n=2 Tax=Sulfurisphaera tokodaii TaxID=111955 RepID=Q96YU1_SULTO|nr:DMT family transporter [Sulfurisphaera tokodaii]BAB67185.1 putative DMT family transporter [Sulfurisphaera tokodaii str. 7]HII72916.1 EamA family transporter [Sulfurisphaera tokodaii]